MAAAENDHKYKFTSKEAKLIGLTGLKVIYFFSPEKFSELDRRCIFYGIVRRSWEGPVPVYCCHFVEAVNLWDPLTATLWTYSKIHNWLCLINQLHWTIIILLPVPTGLVLFWGITRGSVYLWVCLSKQSNLLQVETKMSFVYCPTACWRLEGFENA